MEDFKKQESLPLKSYVHLMKLSSSEGFEIQNKLIMVMDFKHLGEDSDLNSQVSVADCEKTIIFMCLWLNSFSPEKLIKILIPH